MIWNLIYSAVFSLRQRVYIKIGEPLFIHPSHFKRFDYYKMLPKKGNHIFPVVAPKDKSFRVGNFYYATPNVNGSMTWFASIGAIEDSLVPVSRAEWLRIFIENRKWEEKQ